MCYVTYTYKRMFILLNVPGGLQNSIEICTENTTSTILHQVKEDTYFHKHFNNL